MREADVDTAHAVAYAWNVIMDTIERHMGSGSCLDRTKAMPVLIELTENTAGAIRYLSRRDLVELAVYGVARSGVVPGLMN